jgi:hypothetical protein
MSLSNTGRFTLSFNFAAFCGIYLVTSANMEEALGLAVLVVQYQLESILDEPVYEGSDPYLDVQGEGASNFYAHPTSE